MTTSRLAGAWYLATAPLHFAGLAGALRTDRLVTGRRGRKFRARGFWGLQTGPNPTDRAKLGSKRHVICDGRGIPLAIQVTGANRNDSQQALTLVDAIPLLQGKRGRRRHRPDCVLGAVIMTRPGWRVCSWRAPSETSLPYLRRDFARFVCSSSSSSRPLVLPCGPGIAWPSLRLTF